MKYIIIKLFIYSIQEEKLLFYRFSTPINMSELIYVQFDV